MAASALATIMTLVRNVPSSDASLVIQRIFFLSMDKQLVLERVEKRLRIFRFDGFLIEENEIYSRIFIVITISQH